MLGIIHIGSIKRLLNYTIQLQYRVHNHATEIYNSVRYIIGSIKRLLKYTIMLQYGVHNQATEIYNYVRYNIIIGSIKLNIQ